LRLGALHPTCFDAKLEGGAEGGAVLALVAA
jgi:hypothetical protein